MGSTFISGDNVKVLKDNFEMSNNIKMMSGAVDPSAVAVDAPAGSMYQSSATGRLYVKTDAGPSTNWTDFKGDTDAIIASIGSANGIVPLNASTKIDEVYMPSSVVGGLKFKGVWDADTNTPTLTDGVGTNGDIYVVSVSGSTVLDGNTDWVVGDWAIFNGEQTSWEKIDNSARS